MSYQVVELPWLSGYFSVDVFETAAGVPVEITSDVYGTWGTTGHAPTAPPTLIALGTAACYAWEQGILDSYIDISGYVYNATFGNPLPLGDIATLPFGAFVGSDLVNHGVVQAGPLSPDYGAAYNPPYHPPSLYGAPDDVLIDTGANTFFNHGTLLARAGGQLELASTVRNTATIEATDGGKIDFTGILQQTPSGHLFVSSGGEIDVLGTATGGDAVISGSNSLLHFGAKSTVDTTFAAGAAGTLQLDQSNYTGKISGFTLGDSIDLTNITFTAGTPRFHYTPNSTDPTSGGLLRVTDGTHVAKLELQGQYTAANFVLLSDGGGTQIIDPPGNEHPILPILHEIALTGQSAVNHTDWHV